MSGDDGYDLPGYTFRSQYGGEHLSIDTKYTLCGKPITDTWEQVIRGASVCNKCGYSEELLLRRVGLDAAERVAEILNDTTERELFESLGRGEAPAGKGWYRDGYLFTPLKDGRVCIAYVDTLHPPAPLTIDSGNWADIKYLMDKPIKAWSNRGYYAHEVKA